MGPVSCRLRKILLQQDSELLAAVSGKRVLRHWVWRHEFVPDSGGIRYTVRTLEPTSVAKTAEPGAAKPDAGKAVGSSMLFPTDTTINQLE